MSKQLLPKFSRIGIYALTFIGIFSQVARGQSQRDSKSNIGNISVANEKWQKTGIYGGFSPEDEVLAKRSENVKVFSKNGKTTAQIGETMHYKDNSGAWQDISLNISSGLLDRAGYKYGNETQKIKSYYPEKSGTQNVVITLNDNTEFSWWNHPEMRLTANGSVVKEYHASQQSASIHKDKIVYQNVYPQVSEEFVVLNGGVENNTIINQLTNDMNNLPVNGMVELSQFIALPPNAKVYLQGKYEQTTDFEADYFNLSLQGFEEMLSFSPIIIFDRTTNRDEALMLISAPKEKLSAEQKATLSNNVYQSKYYVHFENGGIRITTKLPASWLKNSGRSFPVTVDPTVTIGATPPGTGNFYVPMSHWYGFQRHADLFLQSEIAGYGTISSIEYYKTGTQVSMNKPTKIFMRTTTASTLTGTAAWNSTTYTGGLTANLDMNTDQGSTTGWKVFTLTTPFNYSSNNLLIMTYDAYGGGGTAQYFTTNTPTNRQAYKRQDTNDPGDASATAVESYLPTIRITYSNSLCSAMPSNGAATTTTPTFNCNGAPLLDATGLSTASNITYQWEASPAGQNSWSNVGGALTTSAAFTAPVISASMDYRVKTTCPTFGTSTSSIVTVTVQSITITPATSSICETNSQALVINSPLGSGTLFSENFNSGGTGSLVFTNNSSGANPSAANWTVRPSGYVYGAFGPVTFIPPTGTQFIMSNSDEIGSGASTNTTMTTPSINTSGYSSLTLTFNHYFRARLASYGRVEVYNGTAWVQVANYTGTDVGTGSAFVAESLDLTAYINVSNFKVRFTFNAGWDWYWAIDDIILNGTLPPATYSWTSTLGGGLPAGAETPNAANSNISVTPTGVGTYTYTAISTGCGTSTATVDVIPGPSATIAAGAPICDGETADIMFTGNPGDVITFNTTESVTLDGAGEATYTTPVLTAGSYDYDVNTIANTTCTVNSTLSATQVVNPRPQGTLLGSTTVCKDVPAYISFGSSSVDFPIDVTLSDGVNTYNETATSSAENFIMPSDVPGVFTYEITALSDVNGCDAIAGDFSGTSTVTVNDRPSVIATSAAPGVCEGGNTDITFAFSGQAPYDFTYFDGTGSVVESEPTNTFMFNVLPTAATTYNVEYLADANGCIAQPADIASSATVIIYDTSKIVTQPVSVSACTENGVTITMTATGDLLNYTWYENGTAVPVDPNYTINDNEITINDVSGLGGNEYYVVVSGACGVDKISDTATLTEDFENSWTGTTSTAWSDMSNWSCGRVPIITTNVLVPGTAPFMPLVDITTALCNDVTLAASGASLGFDGTGNVLSVYGNIANNSGDFDGTDGTVVLAGTNQSITGATTYEDLEVMGGGTKVLDGDATVTGELILTDGFLSIGDNNLTIADMTMQTTGSAASYVVTDGTGEVVGQNMGSDSTLFHVGLVSSYNPVAIKNTGTPDTFMVRVMEHVYIDGDGTDPAVVDNPVVDRTWMISEQTDGGSFASVTPQWSIAEELGGFDQSHVYVAHFMGGLWTSPVDSTLFTPAAVAVGTMWSAMEDSIESFSPFAVASHGNFPLAIRLTSISAVNVGRRNKVEWKSVSEDAGDIYELERSVDGRTFTRIATVAAKGKPSTYTQWDANPVEGVNYYRAKLVSTDGKYNYSKVVSATMSKTGTFTIEAYPNPVHNTVSVKVNGVVTGKGSVVVTDVTGKVVSTATVVEHNSAELNVSHLANGIYLLNYSDEVRNESIKINKQ